MSVEIKVLLMFLLTIVIVLYIKRGIIENNKKALKEALDSFKSNELDQVKYHVSKTSVELSLLNNRLSKLESRIIQHKLIKESIGSNTNVSKE